MKLGLVARTLRLRLRLRLSLKIKVICGVDHDDLKQLFHVSKTVRDATLIAKQFHFAYSTPSKTRAFRNSIESLSNPSNFDMDFEAPNAPKQSRRRNRPQISGKKLEDISIALFADDDDDHSQRRPRRSLFMETEI
uniref:F-box domain-containing protein n=1 Tax=Opuntia streptacantha TaxID=393608 RepID=A0A7C8ZFU3_OPUST